MNENVYMMITLERKNTMFYFILIIYVYVLLGIFMREVLLTQKEAIHTP